MDLWIYPVSRGDFDPCWDGHNHTLHSERDEYQVAMFIVIPKEITMLKTIIKHSIYLWNWELCLVVFQGQKVRDPENHVPSKA